MPRGFLHCGPPLLHPQQTQGPPAEQPRLGGRRSTPRVLKRGPSCSNSTQHSHTGGTRDLFRPTSDRRAEHSGVDPAPPQGLSQTTRGTRLNGSLGAWRLLCALHRPGRPGHRQGAGLHASQVSGQRCLQRPQTPRSSRQGAQRWFSGWRACAQGQLLEAVWGGSEGRDCQGTRGAGVYVWSFSRRLT